MKNAVQLCGFCLMCLLVTSRAGAQLFGNRPTGQGISRGSNTGMFSGAGQAQGNARYMRGNRARTDFVGSDQGDKAKFVGSTQASTATNTINSLTGLKEPPDQTKQINQPLQKPADKQMYLPTYRVDWDVPGAPATTEAKANVERVLANSSRFSQDCQFEVIVVGRTAILRGSVTSAKERVLAENVVRLEPGVSKVQNELVVVPQTTFPAPPPPDPSP